MSKVPKAPQEGAERPGRPEREPGGGSGTHHDGDQGSDDGSRGSGTQEQLGQQHVEGRLQRLDGVCEGDSHSCKGQVGRHVADGVHGGRQEQLPKLLPSDWLRHESHPFPLNIYGGTLSFYYCLLLLLFPLFSGGGGVFLGRERFPHLSYMFV